MINLPSAIKLIFYLIQCAISYSLLYLGHGVDIFDNLDIILYIVRATRPPLDGNSYTYSTDEYSIMPSIWSSIPAITVWVVALFLVSEIDKTEWYWEAVHFDPRPSLTKDRPHWLGTVHFDNGSLTVLNKHHFENVGIRLFYSARSTGWNHISSWFSLAWKSFRRERRNETLPRIQYKTIT